MVSMPTLLTRLKDVDNYLSRQHSSVRSALFERLICQAFAALLHLPFFDARHDDSTQPYRVTWFGTERPPAKTPRGPDGRALAHGFCLGIEATRKTTPKQWSQEFNECLEHAHYIAQQTGKEPQNVYSVLVTTTVHVRTFRAARAQNERNDHKIVLMEVETLRKALETASMAFTMRHLEVRELVRNLLGCLADASSVDSFRKRTRAYMPTWETKVLKLELSAALAVKSYEAMIRVGRKHVAVSEILTSLTRDNAIDMYLRRIDEPLGISVIARSLKQESLGAVVGKLPDDEELFCPVPLADFRSRCQRRLRAVEDAHGGN